MLKRTQHLLCKISAKKSSLRSNPKETIIQSQTERLSIKQLSCTIQKFLIQFKGRLKIDLDIRRLKRHYYYVESWIKISVLL